MMVSRCYPLLCAALSFASMRPYDTFDTRIYILCGISLLLGFWRFGIFLAAMLVTLLLALLNLAPMFASRRSVSFGMASGAHSFTSVGIDSRVLLLLVPFVILNYPRIRAAFSAFLNDGEDEAGN